MRVLALSAIATTLALATSARAETFTIPPYLSYSGGSGLTLSWHPKDHASPRTVRFFSQGELVTSLEAERDGALLRATLPVTCDAAAKFSYHVDGMTSPELIAALPCDDDAVVRFGFLTDTQTDYALSQRFAARLSSSGGAFVLHGGDMVQVGGNHEEWRRFLVAMAPFASSRPLLVAPGNHEFWFDARGERVRRFLGVDDERGDYVFSTGPLDVVVLSTSFVEDRDRRVRQLVWLRQTLSTLRARSPDRWLVVLFHHPPFSKGIAHSGLYFRREYQVLQRYYVPAFEEHGVDLVLSGHTHLYERSEKRGVTYVVGGAAGGVMGWFGGQNPWSKVSRKIRTLTLLEVSRERLLLRSEDLDGVEIDRIELARPVSKERS